MKKLLLILSLIFSLVFLSSCADRNNNANPNNVSDTAKINDYYPFKENVRYIYEGMNNEYASYNTTVDYIEGNRIQTRTNNGGTEMVKVLENKDGQLQLILERGECYYRENLTQNSGEKSEIILKEPLTKGTEWTLSDNRKRSITNMDVEITTPSGTYKTLEVTTEGKDDKNVDYYAPNIGLVKTIFTSNETEITSTLKKLEENVVLTQTVKFYYPNVDGNTLNFVERQLSFKTNDITKIVMEDAYKELPKGKIGEVLSTTAKINSLYLNKDNMVYIDFTKELVSEMNAGSGFEGMILQCIANTFGLYYGAEKVYLTIEGNPYSSGHFLFKKGETLSVNTNNSVEIQQN
ncbi:MAG: GerMN domain-containing protein [Desulfitobacteriaceae bacterium]|nr:GerMN domain-containing protein [Desulfitobacteriaceae bacterium]MDD4345566.1 GerMN domain-containing protein [Desulfitobacteriaceae bacterium]MDD4401230.1 GerMN domain-containing protein [Desulfitobacteriaceae bacterium]